MELKNAILTGLDISAEKEILTYTHAGASLLEAICRVDLGSLTEPLAGAGGLYRLRWLLNDVPVLPNSEVTAPVGSTRAVLVSRAVPIAPGNVIRILVTGRAGDVLVTTVASLREATPLRRSELYGEGTVIVNHDYGGADNLAIVDDRGVRVDNATVRAFLATDYAAGNTSSAFVVGTTQTDINGRWRQPLMLDPTNYVLVIFKRGVIRTRTYELTVVA